MNKEKTFYIDRISQFEYCDNNMIFLQGGNYEIPFHVEPTETAHNLDNCANCNSHHKTLIKEFEEKLEKFPNCCESHSRLPLLEEFNKEHYKDSPLMIADAIMFSYHHFLNFIDEEEWYNEITSYIDYCIKSFGYIPLTFGNPFELNNYFNCFLHLLKHAKGDLKSEKIETKELLIRYNKIVSYLEGYFENENEKNKNINLLFSKYNEWYKTFPFDLSYFQHLKGKFRMTIPLFKGKVLHNKYLGTTTREQHTKESLTKVLIDTTKNIISNINGLYLYEKGELTEIEKIELELILQNRKIELKEIESASNNTKQMYIKTLKKWLKSEKKFVKEISPLLKNKHPKPSNNLRPNRTDIAYYVYYMSTAKLLKLESIFPSDKAWHEIGIIFSKNSKNIQQAYNSIIYDKEERLKTTKIRNIKYVIENMLAKDSKAKKIALDELKLAELKS